MERAAGKYPPPQQDYVSLVVDNLKSRGVTIVKSQLQDISFKGTLHFTNDLGSKDSLDFSE